MGISHLVDKDVKHGESEGNVGCGSSKQSDESVELVRMEEASDDEASDYKDVLGLSAEDIIRMVFRTEQRAYEFYRKLGKCHGFGVRKGDYGKDDNGKLIRRRFFCNRAGLRDGKHYVRLDRKRNHKPETRTNCEAKLSIYLDHGSSTWKVRKVILEHNHELTPRGMVHLMPHYRGMSDAAKAHIDSMHIYGLPTSKIVGYMSGIAGGYSLLGFTRKDVYNHIDRKKRNKIADGDMNATIVYLQGKAAADPMSMARYNITEEGMLTNLFWADGASRVDFQHFGDVVAFDSTYKKNKYRRPLVIFSGINNHKQTTIFGFGLLLDETIASYTWMLENLLEVMCNRMPSVVVTDGDDAIIAAVRKIFPYATHRLCAWHLQKNVTSNASEQIFKDYFSKWLYGDMGVEEFETEWDTIAEEFGLREKCWALQMYEKRHMWANAYLRGKFCAGYRTTSMCEGLNSHVKKFLSSRHTILELVQNLEVLVCEYRNNELVAQFNSLNSMPVMTTCLDPIEKGAAVMYTRAIFSLVKKEIVDVGLVNFVSKRRVATTMVYRTEEYGRPGRVFITLFDRNMGKIQCGCHFWDREGFPCRHMFFVMKHEHVQEIPPRLVLRRWRIDAKSSEDYIERGDCGSERGFLLRHGALHEASRWMLFLGAKNGQLYTDALKGIRSLCVRLNQACGASDAD